MTKPTTYPDNEQVRQGFHAEWLKAVRELAGSRPGFPQQAELRTGQDCDLPREPL